MKTLKFSFGAIVILFIIQCKCVHEKYAQYYSFWEIFFFLLFHILMVTTEYISIDSSLLLQMKSKKKKRDKKHANKLKRKETKQMKLTESPRYETNYVYQCDFVRS